jgi:hypothetical protein
MGLLARHLQLMFVIQSTLLQFCLILNRIRIQCGGSYSTKCGREGTLIKNHLTP